MGPLSGSTLIGGRIFSSQQRRTGTSSPVSRPNPFKQKIAAKLLGVPQDQDDRIAAQEHLADKAILVHRLCLLLASVGQLCPHLANLTCKRRARGPCVRCLADRRPGSRTDSSEEVLNWGITYGKQFWVDEVQGFDPQPVQETCVSLLRSRMRKSRLNIDMESDKRRPLKWNAIFQVFLRSCCFSHVPGIERFGVG